MLPSGPPCPTKQDLAEAMLNPCGIAVQQEGAGQATLHQDRSQGSLSEAILQCSPATHLGFGASPRQGCCTSLAQAQLAANCLFSINPNSLCSLPLGWREKNFAALKQRKALLQGAARRMEAHTHPQAQGVEDALSCFSPRSEQAGLMGFPGTSLAMRTAWHKPCSWKQG